jgi:hypothetical protein
VAKFDPSFRLKWELMNHTELLTIAQRLEMPGVTAAISREVLIEALQTLSGVSVHSPLELIKLKQSKWLRRYWKSLQVQAPKDCCPNCPGCPDVQAALCYSRNKDQML